VTRPFPLVLSAPSGGGKTTVARALLARRDDVGYSVSCTTRPPRAGEVDGEAYHFLTTEAFEAEIAAGGFAEFAQVHGRWYGTRAAELRRVMAGGRHVILDIDVQGAEQIAAAFPDAVLVFLLPPSGETLLARLTGRNTDDRAAILRRMRNDLEQTIRRVGAILDAEVVRHARHEALDDRLAGLMSDLEQRLRAFAHS